MKKFKIILTTALFTTLFSCVNGDDYGTPDLSNECVTLTTTKEVIDITSTSQSNHQEWTGEDIIEAYITSSDEGGNFYKSISLVSTDGNIGFSIPVDAYNLYTKYEPGRLVYINMKNRYYQIDNSATVIGSLYDGGDITNPNNDDVGRISGVEYEDIILRSCSNVNEDDLVNHVTIAQASSNQYINKLIEFDNVQFTDASLNQNYYDTDVFTIGGGTNHQITDEFGNTITVRVSEFATFAGDQIPSGNGKIRGVLTKFGSTWQFMIRTLNDVKLDQPRIDSAPPLGGTNIQYLGSFLEDFETYTSGSVTTGQKIFPKYVNDPVEGGNYWYCEAFSNNKYLKMTAFSSNSNYQFDVNRVYFIMPVDFSAANNMSFKSQDRFDVGGVLKVYYSTDYAVLGNVDDATLVDITSNFTIASGTTGSASQPFVNSGVYNFPTSLTGNGFILFEYTGGYSYTPALTTTMHIDDIAIN